MNDGIKIYTHPNGRMWFKCRDFYKSLRFKEIQKAYSRSSIRKQIEKNNP